MNYEAQIRADIIEDALSQAFALMTEAHAIMRRCHCAERGKQSNVSGKRGKR